MRATHDHGVQHIGQREIQAVNLLSVANFLTVDVGYGASDQPESGLILEVGLVGHGLQRSVLGEFRVTQSPVTCDVNDEAIVGRKAGRGATQPVSRGRQQHGPCTRTGLPHRRVVQADAQASPRELVLEPGVPVSLLYADRLPVDVEFLGDDHRQCRFHALTHLGILGEQRYCAVGADVDQRVQGDLGAG